MRQRGTSGHSSSPPPSLTESLLLPAAKHGTLSVAAAFAAIYVIWGSTYLAIRYAVETLPPLMMAGTRFLVAGSILYAFVRARGVPSPTRLHWRNTAIIGGLLLLGGNGGVVWAEQTVPSSVAALLIISVPIWMVLVEWLRPGGVAPRLAVIAGVALGIVGVAMLMRAKEIDEGHGFDRVGGLILICGSFCWSLGSVWSRNLKMPASPLMATAMEMLCGGALLMIAGLALGEAGKFSSSRISLLSVLSLAYLIVFGSLVAFSSYVWLLKVSTPARVSTYAFVNPVVAVLLGVTVGKETFGGRSVIATVIILTGVILITLKPRISKPNPRTVASAVANGDSAKLPARETKPDDPEADTWVGLSPENRVLSRA